MLHTPNEDAQSGAAPVHSIEYLAPRRPTPEHIVDCFRLGAFVRNAPTLFVPWLSLTHLCGLPNAVYRCSGGPGGEVGRNHRARAPEFQRQRDQGPGYNRRYFGPTPLFQRCKRPVAATRQRKETPRRYTFSSQREIVWLISSTSNMQAVWQRPSQSTTPATNRHKKTSPFGANTQQLRCPDLRQSV